MFNLVMSDDARLSLVLTSLIDVSSEVMMDPRYLNLSTSSSSLMMVLEWLSVVNQFTLFSTYLHSGSFCCITKSGGKVLKFIFVTCDQIYMYIIGEFEIGNWAALNCDRMIVVT